MCSNPCHKSMCILKCKIYLNRTKEWRSNLSLCNWMSINVGAKLATQGCYHCFPLIIKAMFAHLLCMIFCLLHLVGIDFDWHLYLGEISESKVKMLSTSFQPSQQQRSLYGFGSGSNSYNRGYLPSGFNQGSSFGSASISSLGSNGRSWLSLENSRRHLRGSASLCSCNGTPDILSEQNRGPRASKPKSQITADNNSSVDNNKLNLKLHDGLYNRPDFVTEYKDAKFFIIKSYSEDNVHKSIKYSVWASTPNGNRKLDAAYREAKEKQDTCTVFLFFSVSTWYLVIVFLLNFYCQLGLLKNYWNYDDDHN